MKILFVFVIKQDIFTRRSTVLSLTIQLVFLFDRNGKTNAERQNVTKFTAMVVTTLSTLNQSWNLRLTDWLHCSEVRAFHGKQQKHNCD